MKSKIKSLLMLLNLKTIVVLQYFLPKVAAKIFSKQWFKVSKYKPHTEINKWKNTFSNIKISHRQKDHHIYLRENKKNLGLVVFVHGWSGRGDQFLELSEASFESGFSVLCFDLPAHGENPGKTSNIFEFAEFLESINDAISLNSANIICHSAGFLSWSLFSKNKTEVEINKLVLIASPGSFNYLIDVFVEKLNFTQKMALELWNIVGKVGKTDRPQELLSVAHMSKINDSKVLIVHDLNDKSVDVSETKKLNLLWPQAKIVNTSKLGHNRILKSQKVIEDITKFLAI